MIVGDAWARLAAARVGRLGTVGQDGTAHVVPCCFAVDDLVAYSAVDDKPKASRSLRRLANVEAFPTATLLVDHYDEDWRRLWWVRASGPARVLTEPHAAEHRRAVRLLLAKYPQYFTHALDAGVLAISLQEWRSWKGGNAPGPGAVGTRSR
jgi:PPOX class probable F420-dependent enzyme